MSDYSVKRIDEMEAVVFGSFKRARAELGVESFGMQVIDIPPKATQHPEHDHQSDGQEEVFIVLSGAATMVIDGEEHSAPAGTFVRVDPPLRRTVRNDGSETASVLIVSAPRTSGYAAMDWN